MLRKSPQQQQARRPDDLRQLLDGLADDSPAAERSAPSPSAAMVASGPVSPWVALIIGVTLSAIGGAIIGMTGSSAGTSVGIVLLVVGGIATQIGIIAMAVEVALMRCEARAAYRAAR